ncbi:MAG: acyltransferase [Lachnospira sp.]|nr:acyltransferase [Lachnospira sp.]
MKETTQTRRYNNYDLLRILATIAVIVIHVNYRYFAYRAYTPSMDKYYIIESLFNMVSRFSVPIFVMLSGAFLLHKESNGDAKAFYKKSCKKLLVPTLIVMAVFLLIDEISALRVGEVTLLTFIIGTILGYVYDKVYNKVCNRLWKW